MRRELQYRVRGFRSLKELNQPMTSGHAHRSEAETLAPSLPDDITQSAIRVLEAACEREISLATAESCTGGLLASLLTDVEGCSHAFDRGFVVYSEDAKCDLLGIEPALLAAHGAVSREAAIAMAQGALSRSRAGLAVSITGFAGEGDEPGLVHFARAQPHRDTVHVECHFGDIGRGGVRIECLRTALRLMEEALQ
jgi:nicotinamide-nucleotide amidase